MPLGAVESDGVTPRDAQPDMTAVDLFDPELRAHPWDALDVHDDVLAALTVDEQIVACAL